MVICVFFFPQVIKKFDGAHFFFFRYLKSSDGIKWNRTCVGMFLVI